MMGRSAAWCLAFAGLVSPLEAQVAPGSGGGAPAFDSVFIRESAEDTLSSARDAQRRFERLRRQWSPATRQPWSGSNCDEIVGRICLRHHEGSDWWPRAEDPRLLEARDALLATLARSASFLPGEAWITGQRALYLAEAGRWSEAEAVARTCLAEEPASCGGLLGLALHGSGRFTDAERAFREAIAALPMERRDEWTDPSVLLDPEARGAYEELVDLSPASTPSQRELVWRLADPLFLVEGNDRLTEHWSRRVWASLKHNTANAYGMSWGRDLEEVMVRYGWEVGWERAVDISARLAPDAMVGHHHPESRGYMPPAEVLRNPLASSADVWRFSVDRPRDGYAPSYAPVIVPLQAEVLRFPRGSRLAVLAVYALPEDTTHHAAHGHPPFEPPASFRGLPLESGLFLLSTSRDSLIEVRRSSAPLGALLLDAPNGEYLASVEVWDPARGFAARLRQGMGTPTGGPVTLSDLLLLDAPLPDSTSLEEAALHARTPGTVSPGERISVGWEVHGLGQRAEIVSYRMSLARESRGFLRSVGEWLGVARAEEPLRIAWEESGPSAPGPSFRSVTLELPDLDPGRYRLRLELSTAGRTPLISERALEAGNR
jgi:hypothetical protein